MQNAKCTERGSNYKRHGDASEWEAEALGGLVPVVQQRQEREEKAQSWHTALARSPAAGSEIVGPPCSYVMLCYAMPQKINLRILRLFWQFWDFLASPTLIRVHFWIQNRSPGIVLW